MRCPQVILVTAADRAQEKFPLGQIKYSWTLNTLMFTFCKLLDNLTSLALKFRREMSLWGSCSAWSHSFFSSSYLQKPFLNLVVVLLPKPNQTAAFSNHKPHFYNDYQTVTTPRRIKGHERSLKMHEMTRGMLFILILYSYLMRSCWWSTTQRHQNSKPSHDQKVTKATKLEEGRLLWTLFTVFWMNNPNVLAY